MLTKIKVNNTYKQEEAFDADIIQNIPELKVYYGDQKRFPNDMSRFYEYLSDMEISRSKRFINNADERTYVITHALVNKKISESLDMDFNEIKINYFNDVKPYVERGAIEFNISHSSDYFAFALGNKDKLCIGVDIEVMKENGDFERIVHNYFHVNERAYILGNNLSKSVQQKRFYEVWTRKEAFLKMLGVGITEELTQIDLSPGERDVLIPDSSFVDTKDLSETYVCTLNLSEDRVLSLSTNIPVIVVPEHCKSFKIM